MAFRRSLIPWLVLMVAVAALGAAATYAVRQQLSAFGVAMTPASGSESADPRQPLSVDALGWGTRLTAVTITDQAGRAVEVRGDTRHRESVSALAFGTHYDIQVTVARPWFGQRAEHAFRVATAIPPRLEGATERMLGPDGALTLQFDQPVGTLEVNGPVSFHSVSDPARRVFVLSAENFPAGQTVPIEVQLTTSSGIPVPSLRLAITSAPPLSAKITPNELSDLGLAMPIEVTFSEPLADRGDIARHFVVLTSEGKAVDGRWFWYNSTRLRFSPTPSWPARSTVEVKFDTDGIKSQRGGLMAGGLAARFSTGVDRRIVVYLDKQQLMAFENGAVVRTIRVSTGKAKTPTVTGSFYIYARFPLKTMRSRAKPGQPGHYVVENVPYAQYFHADYAFHGAWWHNAFGQPASHGCVNLSTRNHNRRWPSAPEDAGWLYRWASLGVPVTVYRTAPVQTQVALKE